MRNALCEQGLLICPRLNLYVLELPRESFPAGEYWVLDNIFARSDDRRFRIRGTSVDDDLATAEKGLDASDRKGAVKYDSGESDRGIWVRADAIWYPSPPYYYGADFLIPSPVEACTASTCTTLLSGPVCAPPECPAPGMLLITREPIAAVVPLPREKGEWTALVKLLAQDPELAPLLTQDPIFPEPKRPRIDWGDAPTGVTWEWSGGVQGVSFFDGRAYAGVDLEGRWTYFISQNYPIFNALWGDAWGVGLRARALAGMRDPSSYLLGVGMKAWSSTTLGNSDKDVRFRGPDLLEVLAPELGVLGGGDMYPRFYTEQHLPFGFLLNPKWALELQPSFGLSFGSASQGGIEPFASISLSLLNRQPKGRCP